MGKSIQNELFSINEAAASITEDLAVQNEELLEEKPSIEEIKSTVEPVLQESSAVKPDESVTEPLEVPTEIHTIEEQTNLSPKNGLKKYLESKGHEVVDKRGNGGALWLIGGQELAPLITELKEDHISFTYAYNGSKSTDRRPAWFSTYQD